MNDNSIILLAGIQSPATATSTEAARVKRDQLLSIASGVTRVDSLLSAETAAETLRALKDFTRTIESARKDVKEPVLDLGKRIDALAKELTAQLEAEANRLGGIIGTWQAEQERIAREAREKAEAEERRLWEEAKAREVAEAKRLADLEAERQRVAKAEQDALLAKAERARSEAGRQKALEEAERLKIQREIEEDQRKQDEQRAAAQRNQEVGKQMVAARVEGMNVVAAKPAGVATRTDYDFEVTDMALLQKECPYLVTVTENRTMIKTLLKSRKTIPGIRFWQTSKTHAR